MNSQKRKIVVKNENRAIKQVSWLRTCVWVLLLTSFLLFGRIVLGNGAGANYFIDDFETYDLGALKGQGGWTCPTTPFIHSYIVNDDKASSGTKSIRAGTQANVRRCEKVFGEVEYAIVYFDFYFTDIDDFTLFQFQDGNLARIQFSIDDNKIWFLNPIPDVLVYDNVASSTWHTLIVSWNADNEVGVKLDDREWENFSNGITTFGIDGLHFTSRNLTGEIWIDNIREQGFGECGFGSQLRFCDTESECEAFGGYWLANFCWEIEPPAIVDFTTYYGEHSRFATPTSLTTSLVNLISPILESAGGWIVAFEDIFDIAEAQEIGIEYGDNIPIARGYLAGINDFVGGFPISEAFIFFLIITLAVGIFRIIRNIIQLIKVL